MLGRKSVFAKAFQKKIDKDVQFFCTSLVKHI